MTETTIYIISTIFLLLANAYFAAIEYSLLRLELYHFKSNEENPEFEKLGAELRDYLAPAAIFRTLILLLFGYLTLSWSIPLVTEWIVLAGIQPALWLQMLVVLFCLTMAFFFYFIASELVAKSLAIELSEKGISRLARILKTVKFLVSPLCLVLNWTSSLARTLLGIRDEHDFHKILATSELVLMASRGTDQQPLDLDEKEMVQGVFSLSETIVREVMTPRTDVVAVQEDATLEDVLDLINESAFSRLPVYGKNRDDIKGILLAKDLIPLIQNREQQFRVTDFIREANFVPETKPIDDLLAELKAGKFHMVFVVDEHGGFSGLVTLEDLLEEIVGEILDESDDDEESQILQSTPGHYELDGGVLVGDINEYLDPRLPVGEYDTIAGFVVTHLGKIPESGSTLFVGENRPLKEFLNGSAAEYVEETIFDSNIAEKFVESEPDVDGKALMIKVTGVNGHRIEQVEIDVVNCEELYESQKPERQV